MSAPSAMFRAMRMLHTSDWHLGRSLHRADLRAAQAAFLDHLVDVVRAERVDVVLVAGDVYDRAVPPVDAVQMCEDALLRLHDTGARIVLISGNHDSARRLGFGSALLDKAGVHLRTQANSRPVLLTDAHGPVAVYGAPYAEPGVLGDEILARRGDGGARGGRRRFVLAHGWVTGGAASDSERDITVGGVGQVPAATFAGFSYAALGHLHGQQTLPPHPPHRGSSPPSPRTCATAARRCPIPFPRRTTTRAAGWLNWTRPASPGPSAYPRRGTAGSACCAAGSPPCPAPRGTPNSRTTSCRSPSPTRAAPRARWTRCGPGSRTSWCSPSSPKAPCPTPAAPGPGSPAATIGPSRRSSSCTSGTPRPPTANGGCSPTPSRPSARRK